MKTRSKKRQKKYRPITNYRSILFARIPTEYKEFLVKRARMKHVAVSDYVTWLIATQLEREIIE